MTQKVLQVGTSAAVTIPKEFLKELGLKVGASVSVEFNARKKVLSVRRAKPANSNSDGKIARLTLDFIRRYRKDLKALADK
jgi:antitoxin component of MazEF toxin-antitoxin module